MAFYATMKNKTEYKTTVIEKYSDGAPKIINFDPVPNFDKAPSFKEKSQKPQQEHKPLVYDKQTSCKQENFTDEFFPLTNFWIVPPFGGLKRLREVRKQILEILTSKIRPEEKTKKPASVQLDFSEDLVNEFIGRF